MSKKRRGRKKKTEKTEKKSEEKNKKKAKTSKKTTTKKTKGKKGRKPSSYAKKAAKLKRNRGKAVQVVHKQKKTYETKRGLKQDKARKALPPGWRVSKDGELYYEDRRNRSDMPGSNV